MDITSAEFNPFSQVTVPWPVLTLRLSSSGSPATGVRQDLLNKL